MPANERVAIITGAGRGLGAGIGQVFAREGMRVVLCDIERPLVEGVAQEIQASGGQAPPVDNDISKPAETERLVQQTLDHFGRVDVLVNNAGICPRISIDDMTEDMYDRIMNVNLKSVFFLSRAA